MSEVVGWIAGILGVLFGVGAVLHTKKVQSDRQRAERDAFEAKKAHLNARLEAIRKDSERQAAEAQIAALQENEEIRNDVRNNPPGSVVRRWNAGGRRSTSGDGQEPGDSGAA